METIGIIGAGEVGSQIARAAVRQGYKVVIANSRGPETLGDLVSELGPSARAATAAEAAESGDFVVITVPLSLKNDMPVVMAGNTEASACRHDPGSCSGIGGCCRRFGAESNRGR
jgi:predicted dinucleotide-binding enzyme